MADRPCLMLPAGRRSARAALRVLEGLWADQSRSGRAGSFDPTRRPEPWRPRFPGGGTQGRSPDCHVSASVQPVLLKPDDPPCTCRAGPHVVRVAGAPCRPRRAYSPADTAATAVQGANRGDRQTSTGSASATMLDRLADALIGRAGATARGRDARTAPHIRQTTAVDT